jgi:hypothetical protein
LRGKPVDDHVDLSGKQRGSGLGISAKRDMEKVDPGQKLEQLDRNM